MGILTAINDRLGRNAWPIPEQEAVWSEVEFFRALRESDGVRLRQEASIPWNYPYVITPVPRMLSRASAGMLFGEPPTITFENDADTQRANFIVDENDLPAEFHRGAVMASSEGDVFGRVVVRPDVLDAPIIEYVSRERVIPRFSGRFLTAATFITTWQEGTSEFVRLFEHYEPGAVRSELYRGTSRALGIKINLDSYSRTKGTRDVVLTGIQHPLAVFVPNSIDADPTRGFSDYRGLEARFAALNETATIGQANMRLAGKKRALIDGNYMKSGTAEAVGDDVWIRRDANGTMGDPSKPLQMLEYSFEASSTVAWIDHLLDSTLLLAGFAPESVGRNVNGGAISGTALRLRMTHTLIESSGKGRFAVRGARILLRHAAAIDARPTVDGGFGRKWSSRDPGLPTITLADPLPRDDKEAAERLVMLTNANAISTDEKVRAVHPEWDEDKIAEEVEAIDAGAAPTIDPNAPDPNAIGTSRPALVLPGTAE